MSPGYRAIGAMGLLLIAGGCGQQAPAVEGDSIIRGKQIFEKNRCAVCHRPGGIGVSLEDVGKRLKREDIRAWIADPKKIKPNTRMPKFKLTDEELDVLTDYVMTL